MRRRGNSTDCHGGVHIIIENREAVRQVRGGDRDICDEALAWRALDSFADLSSDACAALAAPSAATSAASANVRSKSDGAVCRRSPVRASLNKNGGPPTKVSDGLARRLSAEVGRASLAQGRRVVPQAMRRSSARLTARMCRGRPGASLGRRAQHLEVPPKLCYRTTPCPSLCFGGGGAACCAAAAERVRVG